MKRFILVWFALIFLFSTESYSQTLSRNSVFKCAEVFGDSITFLNDFKVIQAKRKSVQDPNGLEWEVYLMKGTVYRFALCTYSKPGKTVLKLYNDTLTEKHPIYEVIQPSKNKYFDFICKKSDVYKVSIRFKDEKVLNQELSALGILGFIRKIKL